MAALVIPLLLVACAPAGKPVSADSGGAPDTDPGDTDSAVHRDSGGDSATGPDSAPDTGPPAEIPPGTFALAGAYNLDAADLVREGDYGGDGVGYALAIVPDLDRDGVAELLLAAPYRGADAGGSGAWLVSGDARGAVSVSDGVLLTDGATYLGDDVAVGDRDGDGIPDLAVSGDAGDLAVAVVEAPVAGPVFDLAGAGLRVGRGATGNSGAGRAIAFGDLDGDGLDELLVGAGDDGGGVYVLGGASAGDVDVDAGADARWAPENDDDRAGFDLTFVGDVDADGYDDALVGAFWARNAAGARRGRAYLVRGPATGLGSLANADARIDGGGDLYFGRCVTGLPDVDGDALPDLAIDAKENSTLVFSGAVRGDVDDGDALASILHYDETEYISGPCAVAGGDANGDGVGDVLVGFGPAYGDPAGGAGAGESLLYLGPFAGDLDTDDAVARFAGWDVKDMAGWAVALGDVDGDTLDDVVIGALRTWSFAEGRVAVVLAGTTHAPPSDMRATETTVDVAIPGERGFDEGGGPAALDIDGDGVPELVVSSPGAYTDTDSWGLPVPRGAVRFLAPGAATIDDPVATLWGDSTASPLAHLVFAPLGDLDGDGAPDLAVAAYGTSVVYLVDGPYAPDGVLADAARATWTDAEDDVAGAALAVGDPDADGTPELYVGAPGAGDVAAWRVPVGTTGAQALADADLVVTEADASGAGAALVGDVDLDGDGLDDLAIGAENADDGAGVVYVVVSPVRGTVSLADADLRLAGAPADANAGRSLVAGDFDGDGVPDLAVGATGYGSGTGAVLGVNGPLTGASSLGAPDFVVSGRREGDGQGRFVTALDGDGDGIQDLAVGNGSGPWEVGVVPGPFAGADVLGDRGALLLLRAGSELTEMTAPGDLDGDGRDDLAVVAETLFLWYGGGL